jgi:hypothetical protein
MRAKVDTLPELPKSVHDADRFLEILNAMKRYRDAGKGILKEWEDELIEVSSIPSNRPCDSMTFGLAIEAMKLGRRVARKGWNGKGMFIFLVNEWTYTDGKQDNLRNLPTIVMKTVDDCAVPWLASQTDMLADDYVVISR